MTRLSVLEATAKAMRAGKLALIRPVTTSTEGRWVASDHVDAGGARQLCQAGDGALGLIGGDHHQVGQFIDHHQQVGQFLSALGGHAVL